MTSARGTGRRRSIDSAAMNLERFIVALGPGEVVNGAPAGAASVEISDLAYDTRTVTPGALFFCVRGRARRRARVRGRPRRRWARLRSWSSSRVAGRSAAARRRRRARRRCRSPRRSSSAIPRRELAVAAVTGTNGKTTTAFLLRSILEAAGRPDGAADEHRAARRRRAAPDRPQHARGDRPAAAAPRDGRRRRPGLRARGDLARPARRDGSKARGSPCWSSPT